MATADDRFATQLLAEEHAACSAEEWVDRCLDDGTVLHCRFDSREPGDPEEEWLDWLVPDAQGNGWFVVTGVRASAEPVEIVVFDE